MVWVSIGTLWMVSGGLPNSWNQISVAQAEPTILLANPVIPIIVKDKTQLYWQAVLAGARKAGQELGIDVVELGADFRIRCRRPDRHSG